MNHANASKSEVWTKCYIDEWWEVAQRIVGRRNYAVSVAAACSSRGRQFFIAVPEACWSTLRSSPEEALIDLSNEFASNKRLVVC